MKPKNFAQAKESALRLLARREHGAYELRQKLLNKGYDEIVIDQVLQVLTETNLQSDQRFVEGYIRRRMAKGFGPLHIINELLKLRIDEQLIHQFINFSSDDWKVMIQQICFKKFGSINFAQDDFKKKARQIRFFQVRGFDISQIKNALS